MSTADHRTTYIRELFSEPHTPERQRQRLTVIADIVCTQPERLQMDNWHSECGTAHCIAGWADHLAGSPKYSAVFLDNHVEFSSIPWKTGQIMLGHEATDYFYTDKDTALEWLQQFRTVLP
jgi:hypothetical protein